MRRKLRTHQAGSREPSRSFVRDPWGPVKVTLDERTLEAWRPLSRPHEAEEPMRERKIDEDDGD